MTIRRRMSAQLPPRRGKKILAQDKRRRSAVLGNRSKKQPPSPLPRGEGRGEGSPLSSRSRLPFLSPEIFLPAGFAVARFPLNSHPSPINTPAMHQPHLNKTSERTLPRPRRPRHLGDSAARQTAHHAHQLTQHLPLFSRHPYPPLWNLFCLGDSTALFRLYTAHMSSILPK